jgi:hypothetical protein
MPSSLNGDDDDDDQHDSAPVQEDRSFNIFTKNFSDDDDDDDDDDDEDDDDEVKPSSRKIAGRHFVRDEVAEDFDPSAFLSKELGPLEDTVPSANDTTTPSSAGDLDNREYVKIEAAGGEILVPVGDIKVPEDFWTGNKSWIEKYTDEATGKGMWRCLLCGFESKSTNNATKAKAHLAQRRHFDVKICRNTKVPKNLLEMFQKQHDRVLESSRYRLNSKQGAEDSDDNQRAHGVKQLAKGSSRSARRSRAQQKYRQPNANITPTAGGSTNVPAVHTPGTGIQESITLYTTSTNPVNQNQAALEVDWQIASLILHGGKPFSLVEDPKFLKLTKLLRSVPADYKPPSRKQISTTMLKQMYNDEYQKSVKSLLADAQIFGLALYADGATIHKTPFINVLASGGHVHSECLEIHDCSEHMATGGTKDAQFVKHLIEKHIEKLDPARKGLVDLVLFDGASNMQKAGRALAAQFPRITCIHGGEHVVSLFFSDVGKTILGSMMIKAYQQIYKWFGGRHHSLYAIFNKSRKSSHSRENQQG